MLRHTLLRCRTLSTSLTHSISRERYRRIPGSEIDKQYQKLREQESLDQLKNQEKLPKYLPNFAKTWYQQRLEYERTQSGRTFRLLTPICFCVLVYMLVFKIYLDYIYRYVKYYFDMFMKGESDVILPHNENNNEALDELDERQWEKLDETRSFWPSGFFSRVSKGEDEKQ